MNPETESAGQNAEEATSSPSPEQTRTQHGTWTPATARAADRELERLAQEPDVSEAATERVDKSQLSLPVEDRPIDH